MVEALESPAVEHAPQHRRAAVQKVRRVEAVAVEGLAHAALPHHQHRRTRSSRDFQVGHPDAGAHGGEPNAIHQHKGLVCRDAVHGKGYLFDPLLTRARVASQKLPCEPFEKHQRSVGTFAVRQPVSNAPLLHEVGCLALGGGLDVGQFGEGHPRGVQASEDAEGHGRLAAVRLVPRHEQPHALPRGDKLFARLFEGWVNLNSSSNSSSGGGSRRW
mmetsp:Transcript_24158/g.49501  ORF Transcript_24158/g.49501 Transcript_24158/m.49501 type:complete len:216 (-) Transcript_24158:201-848(-)